MYYRMMTLGLLISAAAPGCSGDEPPPPPYRVVQNEPFLLKGVADLEEVAQLTGPGSLNETDRYAVAGTDLGSMFNIGNQTYFVFGDTFGYRPPDMTGGGGEDWRSNVIAVATDNNPSNGIQFERFIADENNHANEIIPSRKIDRSEITRIPTHGVAVGSTMYLYFMSVNYWGPPGTWTTNYSGVSRSADGGESWQVLEGLQWEGESNFIQVSPFKIANDDGAIDVYFWGIPAGRYGSVKLMKVPEQEIEQLGSYRYFAGTNADGSPIWSADSDEAAVVVDDTIGELSVVWNEYLGRWIMTYLQGSYGLVIREGLNPWGPWGEAILVATQAKLPGLYGPFMNPRYVENDGETVYFALSRWEPYNVFWMKMRLLK